MVPLKVAYGQFLYFIVAQIIKKVNTNYVYSVVWQIIYFVRSGRLGLPIAATLGDIGRNGNYLSSYVDTSIEATTYFIFSAASAYPSSDGSRHTARSLRCLAS